MDVDPEILARFVDSLKLHGTEHTQGVGMKKEICATILNVRTTLTIPSPFHKFDYANNATADLEVCFNSSKRVIGAHEFTEPQIGSSHICL